MRLYPQVSSASLCARAQLCSADAPVPRDDVRQHCDYCAVCLRDLLYSVRTGQKS